MKIDRKHIVFYTMAALVVAIVMCHYIHIKKTILNGLGSTNNDAYDRITDLVIKMIEESDNLAWRMPWSQINSYRIPAQNFISKKPYQGINAFLLNFLYPFERGYTWEIPYFLSYKQAQELGGQVKKGAKGYPVYFYNFVIKDGKNDITEEEYWQKFNDCKDKGKDCSELKRYGFLKQFTVFNGEDIEGIDWQLPENPKPLTEFEKVQTAEAIIQNMPNRPLIVHAEQRAFYMPATDVVNMPDPFTFDDPHNYYSTLFHELSHATMHKTRLDDKGRRERGEKAYAFEELVAELSASFLCGESGIFFDVMQKNTAAYLKSWKQKLLEHLKEDNKFFVQAAGKAQKSADYILDRNEVGIPKYLTNTLPMLDWRENKRVPEMPKNPTKTITKSRNPKQLNLFGLIIK